ncbi:hypothetical protein C1N56_02340 [Pantoea sp. SGAir0175]
MDHIRIVLKGHFMDKPLKYLKSKQKQYLKKIMNVNNKLNIREWSQNILNAALDQAGGKNLFILLFPYRH